MKYILILLILNFFVQLDLKADQVSGEEIQKQAEEWLKDKNIQSNLSILPEIKYPKCTKIIFSKASINFNLIKVYCDSPNKWSFMLRNKISVPVKNKKKSIDKKQTIWVSSKNLKKGQIINENDIKLSNTSVKNIYGIVTNKNDLIGMKVNRSIRTNQKFYHNNLEKIWTIEKNSKIIVINKIGPITVKVDAIALENGDKNDKIRVKNISSGEILTGYVENKKKINLNAKQF